MSDNLNLESFGYTQELKKTLSFRDLVLYGLVFMSPVVCMIYFGLMHTWSQGHAILTFIIAFVAVAFTALAYGEMVKAFPIAGSTFSYTQRAINPKLGFIAGWLMLLDYCLLPMLVYLMSASYANAMIPQIPIWGWVIIFGAVVTFINYLGVQVSSKVNIVLSVIMFLAIIAFLITAIMFIVGGDSALSFTYIYNPETFYFPAIVGACAFAIVSFMGFDGITTLSEETTVGGDKIRWAILVTCVIQTMIFVVVAFFATAVVPDYTQIGNPDIAFFDIAFKIGGVFFQQYLALVFIVAGIGTCLAAQSAASRLLFGMGRDKVIPKVFTHLQPKYKTPVFGILLIAAIGILGAIFLEVGLVSELISFGGLFGFICVNLSVFVYYFVKNKGEKRSVVIHLIFPVIGIAVCLYLMFGLSVSAKIVGFSWLVIGVIYLVVRVVTSKSFKENLSKIKFDEKI